MANGKKSGEKKVKPAGEKRAKKANRPAKELVLRRLELAKAQLCRAIKTRPGVEATEQLDKLVLVGTATTRFAVAPLAPQLHERTLVVHGEIDDTVPLADVMNWARPQKLPVTVIPGVEHFFHGQLTLLRSLVARHLMSELPSL